MSNHLKNGLLRFLRLSAGAVFVACVASPLANAQFPAAGRRFGQQIDVPAQQKAALDALSPQARAIMDKLTGVVRLSVDDYLYHVGDVPDGAAVSLDDSSWTKGQAGGAPPQGASWIRYWVVVPKNVNGYDLTGATIGFRPMTRGAQAIYVNGALLERLPDDQRPTILFASAKPGDKALIAMKMAPANGNAAAAAGRGGRGGMRGLPLTVEIPATRLDPQITCTTSFSAAAPDSVRLLPLRPPTSRRA